MNKFMLAVSLLMLSGSASFLGSSSAMANVGSAMKKQIAEVVCYDTNACRVVMESMDTVASCAGGGGNGYFRRSLTIDMGSESGKTLYSTALSAFMASKKVSIVGKGVCDSSGYYASDRVRYITVHK